jgi:hypothetical protein
MEIKCMFSKIEQHFPNGLHKTINILNNINSTTLKFNLFAAESAQEIEKACFGSKVFE